MEAILGSTLTFSCLCNDFRGKDLIGFLRVICQQLPRLFKVLMQIWSIWLVPPSVVANPIAMTKCERTCLGP